MSNVLDAPVASKIKMLPLQVANQIAAGEVVERPASVVKELVENSLDAGATRIDVAVTAGGRNLISISDDGCGMGPDDALMSIERQATSKIRTSEDLDHIATMGFRGEALASIASVSRFILRTRLAGTDEGSEVKVVGGSIQEVHPCGCPTGTAIEVRDLFFNMPARRKFLRTFQTEQARIRAMFISLALSRPDVAMSLKADGVELHRLPKCDGFPDRLRDLYGVDVFEKLVPVDGRYSGVRVHGFIGSPLWTRNDRQEQHFFVNGRAAVAPLVYKAIQDAYPALDGDRKPVMFLFIELPPEDVDVNVHPTKREVRFRKPGDVSSAIAFAIADALGHRPGDLDRDPSVAVSWQMDQQGIARPLETWEHGRGTAAPLGGDVDPTLPQTPVAPFGPYSSPSSASRANPSNPAAISAPSRNAAPPRGLDIPLPFEMDVKPNPAPPATSVDFISHGDSSAPGPTSDAPAAKAIAPDAGILKLPQGSPWASCRIIGLICGGKYAMLEVNDGYVVLDPRLARARVLYERMLANDQQSEHHSQQLLMPESVTLQPLDAARVAKNIDAMRKVGFGIEPIDSGAFLVDAVPDMLGDIACDQLLIDVARAFEDSPTRHRSERWREESVAKAASITAATSGRAIDEYELPRLVIMLAACRMPYVCPRGRPTMVFTSFRELARKFGDR